MSVNIIIPSVGESITEGTIARWLKKDGDHVAQGEPLFELETDKATTEVPAPNAGILHISVAEGKTVDVGTTVGTLDTSPQRDGKKKAAPRPAEEKKRETPAETPSVQQKPPEATVPATAEPPQPVPKETPPKPATHADERRERMSPIRLRIAERLLASRQGTATLTTFNEVDLTELENLRGRYRQAFLEKNGVKLGLMSFFVKACTAALKAFPIINARIDGSDIVYHDRCNIGVAVSTDQGLFVPVLRRADEMTFAHIEKAIAEFADKARAGKIGIGDLQDGTFTITNGGVFGSLLSTPILNPPQSAILGMHTIQKRPVAVDDQIVIRPMMYLALSYDHRLIDGRDAVQFLVHVKESIEKPASMLLEM